MLLLLSLGFSETLLAQTRPGNVSPGDVRRWYRADTLLNCFSQGCGINNWRAIPINGATDATGSGCNYSESSFNFRPTVDADALGDALSFSLPPGANGDFAICMVFSSTSTLNTGGFWWTQPGILGGEGPGHKDYGIVMDDGFVKWGHADDDIATVNSLVRKNDGIPFIIYAERDQGADDGYLTINGQLQGSNFLWEQGNLNAAANLHFFQQTATTGQMTGKVAEMIYYDILPNGAERARLYSYMAIRYGITLAVDYVNASNTVIYPMGGGNTYIYNVAGIGRDNASGINQRQSKSSNPEGIVTIANGSLIHSLHSSNATQFTSNNSYLVWGDDNGSSCFSSEIRIPGSERLHYKLDRQWRMQATGAGHVNMTVRLTTNDPQFPLPSLPANSDGLWYMYLNTNADFTTATPIAKPMTAVGLNDWEVQLTPAEMNAYGYFTFGPKLNSSVLSQSYCAGDTFTMSGSFLVGGGNCAIFEFDGATNYPVTQGVNTTNTTYRVLTDGTGECLDVLEFALTGANGTYDVLVNRANGGACGGLTIPAPPGLPYVEVSQIVLASGSPMLAGFDFAYNVDSIYACVGDNNIDFYTNVLNPSFAVSSSTGLTVPQLVSTSTNQVLVYGGSVGRHQIMLSSPTACGVEVLDVVIKAVTPSSFAYQYPVACLGTLDSAINVTPSGGLFDLTAPTSGILLDDTTGLVSAVGATPGIYLITYTNSDTTCFTPSTVALNIPPPDIQTFSYPGGPFCTNSPALAPTIGTYTNYTTGYYVFDSSASGETITVDSVTGAVLFNTATGGDTFVIRYENGTSITPCGLSSYATVVVLDPVPFTFNYSNDTLCSNTGVSLPVIPGGVTGHTWYCDTSVIDLNPITGGIDTDNSTIGGPYTITLEADNAGCRTQTSISIWINGVPTNGIAYPNNIYCEAGPDPLPLFLSGTAGGTFSSSTGLNFVDSITGQVDVGTSPLNVFHQVSYALPGTTCPLSQVIASSLFIVPMPDASFTIPPIVCRTDSILLVNAVQGASGGYSFFLGPDLVLTGYNSDTVFLPQLQADGSYRIQKILNNQNVCIDTANAYFQILPFEDPYFDYSPVVACENTQFLDPFIFHTGGGTFTVDSTINTTTIVDPVNGRIDLDSSGSGWHGVIYTTNGPCPSSYVDSVRILRGFSSYFSLQLSVVCEDVDTITMDTVYTLNQGNANFFTVPPTLAIDTTTGTIYPSITPVSGLTSFDIFHTTGGNGFCPDTTKATFRIVEYDDNFAIDYGAGPFCTGGGLLAPTLTVQDTGNLSINQPVGLTYADTTALGVIDLRFTRPGGYRLRLRKNAECQETASDSITVIQSSDASFSYGLFDLCKSNDTILPTVNTLNGTFSVTPLTLNANISMINSNGAIDVGNSSEGLYLITYTTQGICPSAFSDELAINPNPRINTVASFPNPNFSLCEDDSLLVRATGTNGAFAWFVRRGLPQEIAFGTSGVLNRAGFENGDTLVLKISDPLTGCFDDTTFIVEVLVPPIVTVIDTPLLLDGTREFTVKLGVDSDGSFIKWWQSSVSGTLGLDSSATTILAVNDVADIDNTIDLNSDYDPVRVSMIYRAIRNGCVGELDSLDFIVSPNNLPIFIPEVMTPNDDQANDVWEIRYNQEIRPEAYTIDVYNRSGGKVYTLNRLDERWSGGGNPDGVYWWLLRDAQGGIQQQGGLTIRRQ